MELEQVMAPISPEYPTGYDLREHGEFADQFYSLRDLRNSIRAEERKVTDLQDLLGLTAEWKPVQAQSLTILSEHSKDIEVLAWLSEAAVRTDGFAGLAHAFHILLGTLKQYWGSVFPLPDEEGISSTLYPIAGLNGDGGEGTLIMPLRMAPVITCADGSQISSWDFIKACELASIEDEARREKRKASGYQSLEQLQQILMGTDFSHIRAAAIDISTAQRNFQQIEDFLSEHCGLDAPPTSAIRNGLQAAWDALAAIARIDESVLSQESKESLEESEAPVDETPEEPISRTEPAAAFRPEAYYPASREEALIMVSKLSMFFRDTEPHSPLSYQMERVERWGHMSLGDLMDELLDDDSARNQFYRLIGLTNRSAE